MSTSTPSNGPRPGDTIPPDRLSDEEPGAVSDHQEDLAAEDRGRIPRQRPEERDGQYSGGRTGNV